MSKEIIINNVLCFLQSSSGDYSNEVLYDLIYSFYSVDEIKIAKELIANALKADTITRKDPDKKRKILNDLLELFEELKSKNMKIVYVSDSYKKMPPLGLEFIAPLLTNLSDEVARINTFLPKIVDIRSEVANTADAVRNMKFSLANIENKISNSNFQRHEPSVNLTPSYKAQQFNSKDAISVKPKIPPSPSNSKPFNSISSPNFVSNKIVDLQRNIMYNIKSNKSSSVSNDGIKHLNRNIDSTKNNSTNDHRTDNNSLTPPDEENSDEWTLIESRKKRYSHRRKRNDSNNYITGSKQDSTNNLKGINKTVDIYIGRVDISSTPEILRSYIETNFEINVNNVDKIITKTDKFNSFKVNVELKNREVLFKHDMWPEGIIINKFYNRNKSKDRF